MRLESYSTPSGIVVTRTISNVSYSRGLHGLLKKLDTQRGIYLSSGYEFPGRYSRWDVAAVAPPLEIIAAGREVAIRALNPRGETLIAMLEPVLAPHPHWEIFANEDGVAARPAEAAARAVLRRGAQQAAVGVFDSARAASRNSSIRWPRGSRWWARSATICCSSSIPIELKLPRHDVKDLHLFLCDDIYFMDRKKEQIERYQFDFARGE